MSWGSWCSGQVTNSRGETGMESLGELFHILTMFHTWSKTWNCILDSQHQGSVTFKWRAEDELKADYRFKRWNRPGGQPQLFHLVCLYFIQGQPCYPANVEGPCSSIFRLRPGDSDALINSTRLANSFVYNVYRLFFAIPLYLVANYIIILLKRL